MKKLLIGILMLLLILTACTADGTQLEETAVPTAVPPTEESLEPAPTATEEATVEPTATHIPTATPEPEPTETAKPTVTVEPPTLPQDESPSGTIPDEIVMPEGAVVLFTQTGGFAGFDNSWVFYEDGRVTLNGVDQAQLTPERIDTLVSDLDELGFFETSHLTKPGEFCCDFFDYSLAVQSGDRQNYVSFSDGNLELPTNLLEISALMREITEEAQQL